MTKLTTAKAMNTEIWSSSQMGGTGGALKALVKNLANQLNLNRTEMKRVVARVISERHGQGDVGDYNGHMFYVKPERIDMTEQITHSKEAFDKMIEQKRVKCSTSKSQMPLSRSGSRSRSRSRSFICNMAMSPTKPDRSLPGVINDQHHVQSRHGHSQEINPKPSKAKLKPIKSRQQIVKRRAQTPQQPQSSRSSKISPSHNKSTSKLVSSQKPKLTNTGSSHKKTLFTSDVKRKPVLAKRSIGQQLRSKTKPEPNLESPDTKPAGLVASVSKKKLVMKPKKIFKQLPKSKSRIVGKKSLEQPWQEQKKRLRAGGLLSKPQMTNNKKRSTATRRNSYQCQGAAGATQRVNSLQVSKSKYRVMMKPRTNTKNRNYNHNNAVKIKQKRSQARLVKQLEREEAIDEPERLEADSLLSYRVKRSLSNHSRRGRRMFKLSARLEELAKPVFHGKGTKEHHSQSLPHSPSRSRSHSPVRKPKLKLKLRRRRHRVVVDSSLGSIAGLKVTSRSGLTPAKRHLTLAFMNKDPPRSPRQTRSVMWR